MRRTNPQTKQLLSWTLHLRIRRQGTSPKKRIERDGGSGTRPHTSPSPAVRCPIQRHTVSISDHRYIAEYISGVILDTESLLDFKLAHILSSKGIISGIRAEGELVPIPRSEEEFIVQGMDDLLARLQAARIAGARFSKWRVPIACSSVNTGFPSPLSLEIQAETLAQYAAISQQAGLVPIVEADVEFSRDADLARSAEVHEKAIEMIYERMRAHGVLLEGNML